MKKQILNALVLLMATSFTTQAYAQVGLPTLGANDKFSVIAVSPDTAQLTPQQKVLVKEMKTQVENIMPNLTSNLSTAFMGGGQEISQVFSNIGGVLSKDVSAKLMQMKQNLPVNQSLYFSLYILPWAKNKAARSIDLSMLGNVQQLAVDLGAVTKTQKANFYAGINSKIRSFSLGDTDKFQLQSIAIHIKLRKGESSVLFQMLGGLKTMKETFINSNAQVDIKNLEVFGSKTSRPTLITNIKQNIEVAGSVPEITLEFGQFGGVAGEAMKWPYAYQIMAKNVMDTMADCKSKLDSTPALTGTLAKEAAGKETMLKRLASKVANGIAIKFRILGLKIDATTLRVSKMNLAMEVGSIQFPQCVKAESVNEQFKGEANAAIEAQLSSLYKQDDMTNELMDVLY